MVEVVTGTFDRTWWISYATLLAERFGQDEIRAGGRDLEQGLLPAPREPRGG